MSSPKLAFVMVGLPARGKTFVARKVARYLSWLGHRTQVFNVGAYRRALIGSQQPHTFFDPENTSASRARDELARHALEDLINFLHNEGDVGIYDATNSSRARRKMVRERCAAEGIQVVLIESICNDPSIIDANVREQKAKSPDYAGIDAEEAVQDFLQRIRHYERAYEEVGLDEGSCIKIIDVGRTVMAHHIEGYLPSRLVFFLLNFHLSQRSIWLTRHGESEFNVLGKIGGDPSLSPRGYGYAEKLAEFLHTQIPKDRTPVVWTSTLRRTLETAERFGLPTRQWRALDEIDAGECDGMTYDEIERTMPFEFAARRADKFNYRYPRGESYKDVITRLEPVIFELERERRPVLIVAHQAVLRTLYAYMMDKPPEACPRVPIPLHRLLRLTPTPYGCEEIRYNLLHEATEPPMSDS